VARGQLPLEPEIAARRTLDPTIPISPSAVPIGSADSESPLMSRSMGNIPSNTTEGFKSEANMNIEALENLSQTDRKDESPKLEKYVSLQKMSGISWTSLVENKTTQPPTEIEAAKTSLLEKTETAFGEDINYQLISDSEILYARKLSLPNYSQILPRSNVSPLAEVGRQDKVPSPQKMRYRTRTNEKSTATETPRVITGSYEWLTAKSLTVPRRMINVSN
jgi:hypothetical protein